MPAGPIGACWATDSWEDTAWEADSWAAQGEALLDFELEYNERLLFFLQDFYVSDSELNPLLVQYLNAETAGDYSGRVRQAIQDATDAMT
jgi:hypothetical protein